mmetsp:Transcript_2045/g.4681  ORF Transcript_2045/g.4681 Transcript_2045/m.4681 type:complete len:322 (-) Transcript_2045:294-1259(-)
MLRASFFDGSANDGYSFYREIGSVRSSRRVAAAATIFLCAMLIGRLTPASPATAPAFSLSLPREKGYDPIELPNPMYSEPLVPETVPTWLMGAIAVVVPAGAVLVSSAMYRVRGDVEAFVAGILTSACVEASITEFLKAYCAYPRPNAMAMCGYDMQAHACRSGGDEHLRSFPSGHTGIAFATLFYLSLYMWGKLKPLSDSPGRPSRVAPELLESRNTSPKAKESSLGSSYKPALKMALVSFPSVLACLVGASRIHDRYHWPADVLAGGVIGCVGALVSYFFHFRPPWDSFQAHMPRRQLSGTPGGSLNSGGGHVGLANGL